MSDNIVESDKVFDSMAFKYVCVYFSSMCSLSDRSCE